MLHRGMAVVCVVTTHDALTATACWERALRHHRLTLQKGDSLAAMNEVLYRH